MYLIYLDLNAMAALRGTPSGSSAAFAAILEQHRDRFWIPYSSTHLDDLARGYDPADEKKVKFTYDDLAIIRRLTQEACFQTYVGQERPTPDRRDPVEYFESHYEAQQEAKGIFSTLANLSTDGLGIEGALGSLMDLPAPPFPTEAQDTILANLFPSWSTEGTMRGFMKDMAALMHRANTDYTYSTDLRDLVRQGIPQLEPGRISAVPSDKAFENIEKVLEPFMAGRSVFEMMNSQLKNYDNSKKEPSLMQRFTMAYTQLEYLGYHPEKITPKNHFPNLVGDSVHAFLAGHCDYFITNDKGLRHKAKAVYQEIPTRTQVVSVAEFVELMTNELIEYTPESYSYYLIEAIENRQIFSEEIVDDNVIQKCFLSYRLFDRFNACEIAGKKSISFFRNKCTYAYFLLPNEVEHTIDLLNKCLGVDDYGRSEFNLLTDFEEIRADSWIGRQWSNSSTITKLTCQGINLKLSIEFLPSSDSNS